MKQTKIYNKGFLIFLILAVVFGIGYPILNKYYIRPKKWREELFDKSINQYSQKTDSAHIVKFCNCIYSYFLDKYGHVDNFPLKKDYTKADKVAIIQCTANFLLNDTNGRNYLLKNIDSISFKLN